MKRKLTGRKNGLVCLFIFVFILYGCKNRSSESSASTGNGSGGGTTCGRDTSGGNMLPEGLVAIEGGSFQMGDLNNAGISSEKPVHNVTLSSFYIMDHEVTACEYKECVDAWGCTHNGGIHFHEKGINLTAFQKWKNRIRKIVRVIKGVKRIGSYQTYGVPGKENYPVNWVNWYETQHYITWKNTLGDRVTYRLCTEAEFEYATRAGSTTMWSCGNDESCLNDVARYRKNNTTFGPKAVKTKKANAWGLYDMHGNVWEWVQDWYGSYSSEAQTNPTGPSSGSRRVVRSADFDAEAIGSRSALRNSLPPEFRDGYNGFRLCAS